MIEFFFDSLFNFIFDILLTLSIMKCFNVLIDFNIFFTKDSSIKIGIMSQLLGISKYGRMFMLNIE